MRVGLFSWETLNSIPVGGVAVVVSELAKALAGLGHEVHVFTRMGANQREHELIGGVWEHRCISPPSEDFIEYMDHVCDSLVSCFHYVESKYGKFDVLHAHDWHVVNALANIRQHNGYEFIWTCHSTEWGRNGGNHNPSWFSRRISHREWLGGYASKRVTTVSNTMKHEIMREYQTPDWKTDVIYNGIDAKKYEGMLDAGRVKERYGIWALDPVVLFVGRMSYQKGPDLLVEAISHVLNVRPDVGFIFAGGGGMIDHVRGRAGYLGGGNVRVLDYVSEKEKLELLKACDIVCMPSRNEPFGIVTLEAWASGKPVVATDVGGSSEIIWNFVTGVKVYPTPESISWGVLYLVNDAGKVKWMGDNCRVAAKEFSWKEIAKKYVGVYEKAYGKNENKQRMASKKQDACEPVI